MLFLVNTKPFLKAIRTLGVLKGAVFLILYVDDFCEVKFPTLKLVVNASI